MNMTATSEYVDFAARRMIARGLAVALADPRSRSVRNTAAPDRAAWMAAWAHLSELAAGDNPCSLGPGELAPDMASAGGAHRWLSLPLQQREDAYQQVFGLLISKSCPPYESEYLPWRDATHCSQHLADAAGFFCAFGVEPHPDSPERHDHVSLELEFVALLLEKIELLCERNADALRSEPGRTCAHALIAFLKDHICWWAPAFACALQERAATLAKSYSSTLQAEALVALGETAGLFRAWVAVERRLGSIPISERLAKARTIQDDEKATSCSACGP